MTRKMAECGGAAGAEAAAPWCADYIRLLYGVVYILVVDASRGRGRGTRVWVVQELPFFLLSMRGGAEDSKQRPLLVVSRFSSYGTKGIATKGKWS
jgi:hypothetical protein